MDGNNILSEMASMGINTPSPSIKIKIKDAYPKLVEAMRKVIEVNGSNYINYKSYTKVAEWLEDNKGKGLAVIGGCGVGKTIMTRMVIPYMLMKYCNIMPEYADATDLRKVSDVEKLLSYKVISLDDIGVEEVLSEYGTKMNAFSVIMDKVEKENKLLIFSSNLDTASLESRYGTRTYDRLKATIQLVTIIGGSQR